MTISTLVEPIPGGFRATTGGPLDLAAEGPTAADAFAALQALVDARLAGGAVIARLPLPGGRLAARRSTADIDRQTWDEFLDEVRKNRERVDHEEAERRAAEDAAGG